MLLCKSLEEWLEKNRESIHRWTTFQLSRQLPWFDVVTTWYSTSCCCTLHLYVYGITMERFCLNWKKKIFFQKNCCQAYSPSFGFCLNLCLISKAESCYPVEPRVMKVQYFWNLKIKKSFLIFKCLCFKFGNYHILRTKIAHSVFGSLCPAHASKSSTIWSDCCYTGKPTPCGDIAWHEAELLLPICLCF